MTPIERAKLSLDGLSVGDALGERFFYGRRGNMLAGIRDHVVPPAPWPYTDDTEMALSIFETLEQRGRIDQDLLARLFALRYNPSRGYGIGAHLLLQTYRRGGSWRLESSRLFEGKGSYGNGAAMRVAPVGAFFADDLSSARQNAILSAQTTHMHRDGIAGAVAIAVAAALAWP